MTSKEPNDIIQIAKDFILAVETRKSAEDVARFYHDDVVQTEFPNAITKTTAVRKIDDLRNASQKGKQVLSKEKYKIVHAHKDGNTVIIEAVWTGTLAVPLGKLAAGDEMKAYFAQFFEFKEGKIFRQRNYDCFEPF
jgi:ketosteroid isomerase-like protein